MAEPDYPNGIVEVANGLSKAWEFLSGEERMFQYVPQSDDALPIAEFSFYMPLKLRADSRRGGVGVLIQRDDATLVAANMFGVATGQVQHDDLRDACAEVCNVLTDCLATHFGGGRQVEIGLPREAGPEDYQIFAESCVTKAVYQGCAASRRLLIVLYDSTRLTS